ncbi:hypothetical protein K4L44_13340 [Halosquirtibacter laminarini]|uniref:Uncharacterized protein n=1 Tax=Halosquirtibacter laminarini TaxID=3374600 RepID=A0AC61NDJ9_9BACT|nr:hypothetical protein K4L44_13340 [Prolixibacteraceae bacterium]
MTNSQDAIFEDLNRALSGISDKDLRFFPIDRFKTQLEILLQHRDQCPECNMLLKKTKEVVPLIPIAITDVGKERKQVDRLLRDIERHLRKVHHLLPEYYYAARYGSIFAAITVVISLIALWCFPSDNSVLVIITLTFISLILGFLWGNIKDKRFAGEIEHKSKK